MNSFYAKLGCAIAEWARVDEALFKVFQTCVGPIVQCAIIYYRQPGLDVRFKLADEIVRSVLPKRDKVDGGHDHSHVIAWNDLFKHQETLLGMRRRLAHLPVRVASTPSPVGVGGWDVGPSAWDVAGAWTEDVLSFRIFESESEQLRGKALSAKPIGFEQLEHHVEIVKEYALSLDNFRLTILSLYISREPDSDYLGLRSRTS